MGVLRYGPRRSSSRVYHLTASLAVVCVFLAGRKTVAYQLSAATARRPHPVLLKEQPHRALVSSYSTTFRCQDFWRHLSAGSAIPDIYYEAARIDGANRFNDPYSHYLRSRPQPFCHGHCPSHVLRLSTMCGFNQRAGDASRHRTRYL